MRGLVPALVVAILGAIFAGFGLYCSGKWSGEARGFRWGLCEEQYIVYGLAEMRKGQNCADYKPISDPSRVGEASAFSWW